MRPPETRSTLFPYTTLFRSDEIAGCEAQDRRDDKQPAAPSKNRHVVFKSQLLMYGHSLLAIFRSEEHTSELQSHSDLVCRLLLEKKKGKRRDNLDGYLPHVP